MNLRNIVGTFVAVAATCAALTSTAHAQAQVLLATTAQSGGGGFVFTPSGNSGTLITDNGAGSSWIPVSGTGFATGSTTTGGYNGFLNFGPLTLTSVDAAMDVAYFDTNNPPGQTFTITSGANGSGTVLLSGYFEHGKLTYGGFSSHVINFSDVVYTDGTLASVYLNPASPKYDPQLTGNLSFELLGADIQENGTGGLTSFSSLGYTGSFSAFPDDKVNITPVPEPEEYAVMGMASLALCGLMLRASPERTWFRRLIAKVC